METVTHVWWLIQLGIMCAAISVCKLCWGLCWRWNCAPLAMQNQARSQGTQTISKTTHSISTCTTVSFTNERKQKGEDEGHGEEDLVSLLKIHKRLEALERRSLRDMASSDTESPRSPEEETAKSREQQRAGWLQAGTTALSPLSKFDID